MSETNAAIEQYYSLKPFQFSNLVRFDLKLVLEAGWDIEDATYALTIELRRAARSHTSLLLAFTRVRQLEFAPGDFLIVPVYLEIRTIQERQWEGMNYRVWSFEQDIDLSFYCESFEAKVVTALNEPSEESSSR